MLFLTAPLVGDNPGWEWPREHALALIGTYASLLYLTPIVGGFIADKFTGYKWAVVIGCIIMTLGHLSMVFETQFSLYLGLALLVIGTGFFKPNITLVCVQPLASVARRRGVRKAEPLGFDRLAYELGEITEVVVWLGPMKSDKDGSIGAGDAGNRREHAGPGHAGCNGWQRNER